MHRIADALYSIAIALWVGGLWAIGGLAAPTLFMRLSENTALAGVLAGALFNLMAWIGLAAGAYVLIFMVAKHRVGAMKLPVFWVAAVMVLLTAAGHFGVQPVLAQIKAGGLPREVTEALMRNRFATWHGIASGLYLVQSLLGLVLAVIQEKGKR